MRYLVVVEQGANSFGAYVPDLPACAAAGETREEVLRLIGEAIEFHIEGLQQEGQPLPPPSSTSEVVDIAAAQQGDGADRLEHRCSSRSSVRRRLIASALDGTLVGSDAEAVADKASPTVP